MAVVVLLLGSFVDDADSTDRPGALPKHAVLLNVSSSPTGRAIRPGFIGLSIEYSSILQYFGVDPAAPNPTFIRLVRQLAPSGGVVIRIGGDTTDWTWWPTRGVLKPPGVRYALTPRWVAVTRATVEALRAHLILGINLEADSRKVARGEARALLKGLGRRLINGFELGNEPEVYGTIGWYTASTGVSVPGRRPSYDFHSYLSDYAGISSALPRTVPLVGPATGSSRWLGPTKEFLAADPRVRLLTLHVYPLRRCHTPVTSARYPTIAHLLAPQDWTGSMSTLRAALAAAHTRGIQVRVDELNSVSCKGARGVSDVFASALWILDTLFRLARAGVDGVNVHTLAGASYQPFAFTHLAAGWQATVKPIYYGMLLFERAAPSGARLLAISHRPSPMLRSWATQGPGGTVRVVLINDSPVQGMTVAVRPPRGARSAQLERLLAPGLRSTSGVTLAGQTFGALTATGDLTGTLRTTIPRPIRHRYVIDLPPASAALLALRVASSGLLSRGVVTQ